MKFHPEASSEKSKPITVPPDNALISHLMAEAEAASAKPAVQFGSLANIELPGWVEVAVVTAPFSFPNHKRVFYHADVPPSDRSADVENGVLIKLFRSGRNLSESLGSKLTDVLAAGPRVLKAAELSKIERVLGPVGDPDSFKVLTAEVVVVGGKNVLQVTAQCLSNERMFKGIFSAVDKSGTVVDQVYMSTPKDELNKHAAAFNTVVKSIKWK
jgi:hypothetical protein